MDPLEPNHVWSSHNEVQSSTVSPELEGARDMMDGREILESGIGGREMMDHSREMLDPSMGALNGREIVFTSYGHSQPGPSFNNSNFSVGANQAGGIYTGQDEVTQTFHITGHGRAEVNIISSICHQNSLQSLLFSLYFWILSQSQS